MQEPALHIIAAIGTDSSNNTKGLGFSQRKNDEGMSPKNERFPRKGSKKLERGILLLDSDDDEIYESAPLNFNFQSEDLKIKDHDFRNIQSASKRTSNENSLAKNAPPGFKEGKTIALVPKMTYFNLT